VVSGSSHAQNILIEGREEGLVVRCSVYYSVQSWVAQCRDAGIEEAERVWDLRREYGEQ
jgi:hypothetical protein